MMVMLMTIIILRITFSFSKNLFCRICCFLIYITDAYGVAVVCSVLRCCFISSLYFNSIPFSSKTEKEINASASKHSAMYYKRTYPQPRTTNEMQGEHTKRRNEQKQQHKWYVRFDVMMK